MNGAKSPLAEYVSDLRHARGWSREDVASAARRKGFEISASYIAKIEGGVEPSKISVDKLDALAAGIGRTRQDLLDVIDARANRPTGLKPWSHHDFGVSGGPKHTPDQHSGTNARNVSSPESGQEPGLKSLPVSQASGIQQAKDSELRIIEFSGYREVPVFPMSCGEPMDIHDHPDRWINLPLEVIEEAGGPDRAVAAEVRGESMVGCGFKRGDVLVLRRLRPGEYPQDGDEVVANLDGGSMCKVFRRDKIGAYLESSPEYGQPWRTPIDEGVRIVAIVVAVVSYRRRR